MIDKSFLYTYLSGQMLRNAFSFTVIYTLGKSHSIFFSNSNGVNSIDTVFILNEQQTMTIL